MSGMEWLAAMLGLANVWLIVKRSVWNFPCALAMCALYFFVFRDAQLYSDAGLQIFFIAINLYGWAVWSKNQADEGEIVVERMPLQQQILVSAAALLLCALWGTVMARYTRADYPYWDGSIAMISVVSQFLMAHRKLENWVGWIIVNVLSIPLYYVKGLFPTMVLYCLLLGMAIIGWMQWRARLNA